MRSTEAEGRTIDDAIARALATLGVARDRVEIEILANATRGLLGFGSKPARVRATLRAPLDRPAAARAPAGEAPLPEAPPVERPRRPRPNEPHRARRVAQPARPGSRRAPHPDTPPSPAALEKGRAVLAEMVRLCGVDGAVDISDGALVILGDTNGLLIGRRGQTLDALEYVVNRAVGHDDERAAHVVVDANGYRGRRRAALEALAHRMAEKARHQGRPVALNPMSPRERRIIHLALRDDPSLTTRSAGSGFYRRLLIEPRPQ